MTRPSIQGWQTTAYLVCNALNKSHPAIITFFHDHIFLRDVHADTIKFLIVCPAFGWWENGVGLVTYLSWVVCTLALFLHPPSSSSPLSIPVLSVLLSTSLYFLFFLSFSFSLSPLFTCTFSSSHLSSFFRLVPFSSLLLSSLFFPLTLLFSHPSPPLFLPSFLHPLSLPSFIHLYKSQLQYTKLQNTKVTILYKKHTHFKTKN